MSVLFLQYPKCGTCRKAAKWLKDNGVEVNVRDITIDNPTVSELTTWVRDSDMPTAKFFNTSGLKYRALNMKEQIKLLTKEQLIAALATDGMLVKRPIIVVGNSVLVGFNEEQWAKALLG